MKRLLPVILLWLAVLPPSPAQGEDKRKAVPSSDKQAKAMASIRDVYGEEMGNADAKGRRQLAELLIKQAEDDSISEAMRYTCLKQAYELMLASDKPLRALEVIGTITDRYRVSGLTKEHKLLTRLWKSAEHPEQFEEIAEGFCNLAVRALRQQEFSLADDAMDKFYAAARGARHKGLISQAKALKKITAPYTILTNKAQRSRQILNNSPNDVTAHQAVGEYLCFLRDDWKKGLPHLVKGSEANLAGLARADLTSPTSVKEQADLADAWYKEGMDATSDIEKAALLGRAMHYYQKARPQAGGLLKGKIELRLGKALNARRNALPYFRGPVPGGAKLLLTFEPASTVTKANMVAVKDRSGKGAIAIVNNGKLVDGVLGRALQFDGKSTFATFKPPAGPLNKTTELTIACWVRTKQAGGWIIAQRSPYARAYRSGPKSGEFMFGIDEDGKPHFWNYSGSYGIKASATKAVNDGTWHHVVFACKEGKYAFYVDGKLVGRGSGAAKRVICRPLTMGYDHQSNREYFSGTIDDLILYDDALSENEVLQTYRACKP